MLVDEFIIEIESLEVVLDWNDFEIIELSLFVIGLLEILVIVWGEDKFWLFVDLFFLVFKKLLRILDDWEVVFLESKCDCNFVVVLGFDLGILVRLVKMDFKCLGRGEMDWVGEDCGLEFVIRL